MPERRVYVAGPAGRAPTPDEAIALADALWDALHAEDAQPSAATDSSAVSEQSGQ